MGYLCRVFSTSSTSIIDFIDFHDRLHQRRRSTSSTSIIDFDRFRQTEFSELLELRYTSIPFNPSSRNMYLSIRTRLSNWLTFSPISTHIAKVLIVRIPTRRCGARGSQERRSYSRASASKHPRVQVSTSLFCMGICQKKSVCSVGPFMGPSNFEASLGE